jgi:hypothetical protein
MHDQFYAYVNLHAIGAQYFASLPAALRTAINEYNTGLFYRLAAKNYYVKPGNAGYAGLPGVWPPAGQAVSGHGGPWNAPAGPPALGQGAFTALGVAQTAAHTHLGGHNIQVYNAARNGASPFIYDFNNRNINVNYGCNVSVRNFLDAWNRLVRASGGGGAFAWPGAFNADASKLEFAAAVFAESYRDKVQLGAIRLMKEGRFRATFGGQDFVNTLPMCTGGTYWPHQMVKHSGAAEIMNASPTVWQRSYRIYMNDATLPHTPNQPQTAQLVQGTALNGKLPMWAYNKCSKYFSKHVKAWW